MNCGRRVSESALDDVPVVEPVVPSTVDVSCDPPSEEEISVAISQLRKGRAPGPDGLLAESLRLGGAETVRWLRILFDCIWREEEVPAEWRKQLLIPLHKKGSRMECDNFRGIALLSIPSKVFAGSF